MHSPSKAAFLLFLVLGTGWALLLVPGCKDDPARPGDPVLSLTLQCSNGAIELRLRNDGGPVSGPGRFIAAFTDGTRDTLLLEPGAEESVTCQLSNIHGAVTVTNTEWGLEANADDCLTDGLESYLEALDLGGMIPSPLTSQPAVVCTYTFYLENLASAPPTARLIPTGDGVIMRCAFRGIHGNLRAVGSNWPCGIIYGNVAVDSVVVDTEILIDEGGNPEVTLGDAEASIHGIHVNIDGTLGFIVEWITSFLHGTFADLLETGIESAIGEFGSDISEVVVVRSACSQ